MLSQIVLMPSIDAYREMKTREKSRTVIQKKWSRSLTRGSKCSDLTGKMFMLCIGGRLLEVLAHGCLIEKSTILAVIGQDIIFPHRSFTDFQFNFKSVFIYCFRMQSINDFIDCRHRMVLQAQ